MYKYYIILLFFLINNSSVQASSDVVYADVLEEHTPYSIHNHIKRYVAPNFDLSFDEIVMGRDSIDFRPLKRKEISISFNEQQVWLHFTIENNTFSDKTYLLEFPNACIDSIQLYLEKDKFVKKYITTGDIFPYHQREIDHQNFIFTIYLEAQTSYNCYIEIRNRGDSLNFPIYLNTLKHFIHKSNKQLIFIGSFIGMIIFLIIISFITLHDYLRDKTFFYFIFYLITCGLFLLTIDGISFQYFWPNVPAFNDISKLIFCQLMCIFLLQFTIIFLELKKINPPLASLLGRTSQILVIISIVLLFNVLDFTNKIKLTVVTTAFSLMIIFISSSMSLSHKKRHTFIYLIAILPYIIGVVYFCVNIFLGISNIEFRSDLMKVFLIAQMMFFYIAISDRIKSEKKQIQTKLAISERKYKELLNNASESIFVAQDEMIVFANKKFSTLFNHVPEYGSYMNLVDIAKKEYKDKLVEMFYRNITSAAGNKTLLIRTNCSLKEEQWHEITSAFIEWEGRPATLNFMTNVTSKINAEKERESLESQLRHSQKLETIGTLAGGIAHDFNNILTPIIGYAEMAIEQLNDKQELKNDIKNILNSAIRAKELVKQILTFSRQIDVDKEIVDISKTMSEIKSLLKATIPPTIVLEINNNAQSPLVCINKTQLHQVLMNICTNAFQSITTKYGKISVAINHIGVDEIIRNVHGHKLNKISYVSIVVSDNGCGIDAVNLERIFEPFFTTKNVGEGSGLGLSVAHGIIKNYGGEIFVESILGQGSRFSIYLPSMSGKNKNGYDDKNTNQSYIVEHFSKESFVNKY